MPKVRSELERVIGELIVCVQRSWKDEADLPEADESLSVMYRCHDLLQAAKTRDLAGLLRGRSIAGYLGDSWLGAHPQAIHHVEVVEAAIEDVAT